MTNLIEKTKELAELAFYCKSKYEWTARFESKDGKMELVYNLEKLRDSYPAMLAVLGQFEPGDSERLRLLIEGYSGLISACMTEKDKQMLTRLQIAADLMESHVPD